MTTHETVRVRADLIFTTDRGEVPDKDGLERLISDQMHGELDEATGLGCMAVTVTSVSGDLSDDEGAECCEGGHPATRKVYPYLDEDPGVYLVCDDDAHMPISNVAEIERLP